MTKPTFPVAVAAVIAAILAILLAGIIVSADTETKIERSQGTAAIRHTKVSGAGDGLITDNKLALKPGIWRLNITNEYPDQPLKVEVIDADNSTCHTTSTDVSTFIVDTGEHNTCAAGISKLLISNATLLAECLYPTSVRLVPEAAHQVCDKWLLADTPEAKAVEQGYQTRVYTHQNPYRWYLPYGVHEWGIVLEQLSIIEPTPAPIPAPTPGTSDNAEEKQ